MIWGGKNNRFTLAAVEFTIFHVLIYKSDIVLVILCGCETWSHASREEIGLRVSVSGMVRGIFDVSGR